VSETNEPGSRQAADPPDARTSDAAARVPAQASPISVRQYMATLIGRVRSGQAGALPVVAGMILISILFQTLDSNFLTAGNLVNLLVQAAVFSLLAMGEVFVLILGEIDLSVGFVAALGGVIMADLLGPDYGWPWWAAMAAALFACAAIGCLHGIIITRLALPSFVVTLAGLLFWQGVMLRILGSGGTIPINDDTVNNIASANLSNTTSWLVMLAMVGIYALGTWRHDTRRRRAGLVAPPRSMTLLKPLIVLAGGVALVLVCNQDRGVVVPISGVPWVVLLVVAVLTAWTFLLGRTKPGLYLYAVGGNAEAARRAGINLPMLRTAAFTLTAFTACIAGIVYASRLRSISTAVDGGTLVLYAVAAAVIGGTSLFGGRGKALHGVLGGLVIAGIDNGMGLLGFTAASKYMVTAIVLLAAVTIDALARRGQAAT